VASPGTMLAPASQQTRKSSSSTSSRLLQQRLFQHSVMHTTAAFVGQQGTHRRAHAHTHKYVRTYTHTHAHAHTYKQKCAVNRHRCAHVHTHADVETHAHIHMHKHTGTHTRAHTHTHTRTHTLSHAHMHMHAHVVRVTGFAKFSASLATHPHMSPQNTCRQKPTISSPVAPMATGTPTSSCRRPFLSSLSTAIAPHLRRPTMA